MKKIVSIFSIFALILTGSLLLSACNKKGKANLINVQLPAQLPEGIHKIYNGDMANDQINVSKNDPELHILTEQYYEWPDTFIMSAKLSSGAPVTLSKQTLVSDQVNNIYKEYKVTVSGIDWNTKDSIILSFEGSMTRQSANISFSADVDTENLVFNLYKNDNKVPSGTQLFDFTYDGLVGMFKSFKVYLGDSLRLEVYKNDDTITNVELMCSDNKAVCNYRYEKNNKRLITVLNVNRVTQDLNIGVSSLNTNVNEIKFTIMPDENAQRFCKIYVNNEAVYDLQSIFEADTFDIELDSFKDYELINYFVQNGIKAKFNNVEYTIVAPSSANEGNFKIVNVPSPFKDDICTFNSVESALGVAFVGADEYFENHQSDFVVVNGLSDMDHYDTFIKDNDLTENMPQINGREQNYIQMLKNETEYLYTLKSMSLNFSWFDNANNPSFKDGATFTATVNNKTYTITPSQPHTQDDIVTVDYDTNSHMITVVINNIGTLLSSAGKQAINSWQDVQQLLNFEYNK